MTHEGWRDDLIDDLAYKPDHHVKLKHNIVWGENSMELDNWTYGWKILAEGGGGHEYVIVTSFRQAVVMMSYEIYI